jgi:hypothetical protein
MGKFSKKMLQGTLQNRELPKGQFTLSATEIYAAFSRFTAPEKLPLDRLPVSLLYSGANGILFRGATIF